MVHILGDTHSDIRVFSEETIPGISTWTEDTLIILGDWGFVFYGENNCEAEKANLDSLSQLPFSILFLDGNHEGFPYLEQYPEEIRFGAPVRKIRSNIYWLQRGYVYTIEGKTFFTMGGAYSMDKARRIAYELEYGTPIWFERELPTAHEYRRAVNSLQEANFQVDYILSHTAPRSVISRLGSYPDEHDRELTGFLDWIYHEVTFRKWYFGHFHIDTEVNDQIISCFRSIQKV